MTFNSDEIPVLHESSKNYCIVETDDSFLCYSYCEPIAMFEKRSHEFKILTAEKCSATTERHKELFHEWTKTIKEYEHE